MLQIDTPEQCIAAVLHDVADNLDLERINDPTQRDLDRLLQYREVRALLESHS